MKNRRLLLLILLLILATVACGSNQTEPAPEPQAEITAVPAADVAAATATSASTHTPLPLPTATADPAADFIPFEDEFNGITLAVPSDWATDSFFFTMLASNQELLDTFFSDDTPDAPLDGAVMIMLASANEFSSNNLEEILLESLAEMDILAAEPEIVEQPTLTRIKGQEAATAVAQGLTDNGSSMTILAVVIRSQEHDRTLIIIGATATDQADHYMPLMQAIAHSAEVGPEGIFPDFSSLNSFGNAEPIFLNETVAGIIDDSDLLYFSFFGAPTVVYDIIVTSLDDGFEPVVDLLDEDGTPILPAGAQGGPPDAATIRGFQPEDYDTFLISVHGFAGSTGRFELALLERQDTAEIDSRLTGPGHELLASSEISAEHVDRYIIRANVGDELTAVVTPLDGFDAVLTLYDGVTDEKLLEVDEEWWDQEIINYTFPQEWIYFFEVSGFGGLSGAYDIVLTLSPQATLELFQGDFINGWLDESGQAEYALQLQAGDEIMLTARPEEGFDLVIELLNADRGLIVAVDDAPGGAEETVNHSVTEEGTYFIRIRGFAGAVGGRYTLEALTIGAGTGNGSAGAVKGEAFVSQAAGMVIPNPAAWFFDEEPFLAIFSSSQGRLNDFLAGSAAPADDEDLLGFIVAVGLDEFDSSDAEGITAEALDDFAILDDPILVQDTVPLMGMHHEGVYMIVMGESMQGQSLTIMYATLINKELDQAAVLVAASLTTHFYTFAPQLIEMLIELEIVSKPNP